MEFHEAYAIDNNSTVNPLTFHITVYFRGSKTIAMTNNKIQKIYICSNQIIVRICLLREKNNLRAICRGIYNDYLKKICHQ